MNNLLKTILTLETKKCIQILTASNSAIIIPKINDYSHITKLDDNLVIFLKHSFSNVQDKTQGKKVKNECPKQLF